VEVDDCTTGFIEAVEMRRLRRIRPTRAPAALITELGENSLEIATLRRVHQKIQIASSLHRVSEFVIALPMAISNTIVAKPGN
jgi:hypothetical protein